MVFLFILMHGIAVGLARDPGRHRMLKFISGAFTVAIIWIFAPAFWNVLIAILRPVTFQSMASRENELFHPSIAMATSLFESLISAYVVILAIRVARRSEQARQHLVWALPLLWLAMLINGTKMLPWGDPEIHRFFMIVVAGLLAFALAIPFSVVFWFYDSAKVQEALFAETDASPGSALSETPENVLEAENVDEIGANKVD